MMRFSLATCYFLLASWLPCSSRATHYELQTGACIIFGRLFYSMRFFITVVSFIAFFSIGVSAQTTGTADSRQIAAQAFENGQNAQERGDFTTAVRFYTDAIKAEPGVFQIYYQRATALLRLGRTDESEQDLKKVIELKSDFARAYRLLGQIYLDRDKNEEAKRQFARALDLDPKLSDTRLLYASALLKINDFAAAITELRRAIEQGEATALAYALLGVAEERTDKLDEALGDFSRALEMQPGHATALEGRARVHEKRGALDQAISDYSAAYKLQPSRDLALRLAALNIRAGQIPAAIHIYRALLIEKPEDMNLRIELLQLMVKNNQADEAATEIDRLLKAQPGNAKLLMLAGDLFESKPEQAGAYYQRALQADPANNRARVQLGASLVRALKFQEAVPVLNEAITREPDNYPAHASLATALFKLDQYPQAAGEFIWLINRKPEIAASYFFLGISLDRLGDCQQAIRAYQEFVRRADEKVNVEEIKNANLRLSLLQKLAKEGKCKSLAKGKSQ
jgi:tetratricopeptide (TPR) repeat protein